MNSRERVLHAINHREADRVPIAFGTMHTSSIQVRAYHELVQYLGMANHTEQIGDMVQQIVVPDRRLQARFGNDIASVGINVAQPWQRRPDPEGDRWVDEWGIIYYRPPDGYWYDFDDYPLKEGSRQELTGFPWPDPRHSARVAGLHEAMRSLWDAGDKAIILLGTTGGLYEHSSFLRGMENLFTDMILQPLYVEELAERILEWQITLWELALSQVAQYIHMVALADDLGQQQGLLFSPRLYRRIYKPRHRRLIDSIRSKTNAKIWFHSCGAISELIPDLIDVGVEVLDPVQVSAKGMDSAVLKREFGKDLVFWGGGCHTQVLSFGSPDQVRAEVRKRINDLAPGGGYVFTPGHNIQFGVPPENIVALYEAAQEFGTQH
jgi:uroporphyrinogen decarboxylase